MLRSKKYEKFCDEDIIEIAQQKLNDKDRYYLLQEIQFRNLEERVKTAKGKAIRKQMSRKWYLRIIFMAFTISFLIKMMLGFFE